MVANGPQRLSRGWTWPLAWAAAALLACGLLAGHLARQWSAAAVRTETFAFPDGKDRLALRHDAVLGQVETLTVTRNAATPNARVIFTQAGDRPVTFGGWQDDRTALLDFAGQDGSPSHSLLRCGDQSCHLDEE